MSREVAGCGEGEARIEPPRFIPEKLKSIAQTVQSLADVPHLAVTTHD